MSLCCFYWIIFCLENTIRKSRGKVLNFSFQLIYEPSRINVRKHRQTDGQTDRHQTVALCFSLRTSMASVTSVHSNDGDRLHRGCISPQWRGFWLHPAGAKTGRPKGVGHTPAPLKSVQWHRNYGDRGVHCTPPSSGLVPPVPPPSQRCDLCQNFKQTTLTTRLYKVRTNLYPPLAKTF